MLEYTTVFRRDLKRELKGPHKKTIPKLLQAVTDLLESGTPLPPAMLDHPLKGEYKGHRDCHLMNDMVLIYKIIIPAKADDELIIQLTRLGSHSEIF